MITFWPNENKPNEFRYELRPDEGELIYRILGKTTRNMLVKMGFNDEEMDKIHSIYFSF